LIDIFGQQKILNYYGSNYKMILTREACDPNDKNIRKLSIEDLAIIKELYSVSYPQNWFDSRMLETNKYYGYFINYKLGTVLKTKFKICYFLIKFVLTERELWTITRTNVHLV
jgi:hypothetical protein